MWRGNIDIIGFSSGELFPIMKAEVHQYNVSLSDIQACLNRARPFCQVSRKEKPFPMYRSSFSEVTTVGGKKKKLRRAGARAMICKDTFYDELILERLFLFDH
jgi:hypothetical protein